MALPERSEMVAPVAGRVFERTARPGFADCAPTGRARLDCIARWLQDVAYADVADAGLAQSAVWVVRRTRIHVRRWPRFGEEFELATFCSGLGRMWAQRRTTVSGGGAAVETVALWVHLDPRTWRPVPLSEAEQEVYGTAAAGRRVTARLRHPSPPADAPRATWTFRATELDIAAHVNNAAYWQPLEHELLALPGPEPEAIDAEIEFRTPAQAGDMLLIADGQPLRAGAMRWIASAPGEVHASIQVGDLR